MIKLVKSILGQQLFAEQLPPGYNYDPKNPGFCITPTGLSVPCDTIEIKPKEPEDKRIGVVLPLLLDEFGKNVSLRELVKHRQIGRNKELFNKLRESKNNEDQLAHTLITFGSRFYIEPIAVALLNNFRFMIYTTLEKTPYVFSKYTGEAQVIIFLKKRFIARKSVYDALIFKNWEVIEDYTDPCATIVEPEDVLFVAIPSESLYRVYIEENLINQVYNTGNFWSVNQPIVEIISKPKLIPPIEMINTVSSLLYYSRSIQVTSTDQSKCYEETGIPPDILIKTGKKGMSGQLWRQLLSLIS